MKKKQLNGKEIRKAVRKPRNCIFHEKIRWPYNMCNPYFCWPI